MEVYINRDGDEYTFARQGDGNVLWEGPFEHMRSGTNNKGEDFIDVAGGPFIKKGQMLCHVIGGEINDIVDGFMKLKNGYLIKTIPHRYDPDDTSHLADTKIIGGIINTTEK